MFCVDSVGYVLVLSPKVKLDIKDGCSILQYEGRTGRVYGTVKDLGELARLPQV